VLCGRECRCNWGGEPSARLLTPALLRVHELAGFRHELRNDRVALRLEGLGANAVLKLVSEPSLPVVPVYVELQPSERQFKVFLAGAASGTTKGPLPRIA